VCITFAYVMYRVAQKICHDLKSGTFFRPINK
jgi:hypothetical protein